MAEEQKPVTADANAQDYNRVVGRALDLMQAAIYLVAAILLILLALMAFLVIGSDMNDIIRGSMNIKSIDSVLSDILILFVITGLIQTLIVYIKSHSVDPWLVLSVGLTAIIRRVLIFGAQDRPYEDVALTAVLLFVIIIGLYLIDRKYPTVSRE
ncbi:MAG TPA: phosphate-starvation-inducible PsiE family protein [Methanocella sp.]